MKKEVCYGVIVAGGGTAGFAAAVAAAQEGNKVLLMAMGEAAGVFAAHPGFSYGKLREILRTRDCIVDE